jgi:hypothetical protein
MQPSPPAYLLPLIIVAFAVVFTTMWSGVCLLISLVSGWRAMAERFACPEGLTGASLGSGYAVRVGLASYRGVMSFEAAPQGLIVRVMRLFPFHRPLLLPWGALTLSQGGGFFFAGVMKVAGGADFMLNGDAFGAIGRAMGAGASSPAALR